MFVVIAVLLATTAAVFVLLSQNDSGPRVPQIPPGAPTCDAMRPCPAGDTCVALPQVGATVCVPPGSECKAAGCPGECVVMESYPVQVRCVDEKPSQCILMREQSTGRVDCFGCANGICKDPAAGWMPFERDPNQVGIPYACYVSPEGCALAQ